MAHRHNPTWNGLGAPAAEATEHDSAPPEIEVHGSSDVEPEATPLPSWSAPARLPPPPSLPKAAPAGDDDVIVGSELALAPESGEVPAVRLTPEAALDEQIGDLEAWATVIVRQRRLEVARYWTIRGLSVVAAGTATALSLRDFTLAPVILIAVAAVALAIEMGWPRGSVGDVERRAVYDLRDLQQSVKLRWQKVRLSHPTPTSRKRVAYAVELLETIHFKRREIGAYIGDSEPNPGIHREA